MHLSTFPLLVLLLWSHDSMGRLLRVVTVRQDPFYQMNADNRQEGFLVDLMEDLMERANLGEDEEVSGYRFYQTPDNKYGVIDENGRWDGMMGEVTTGKADLAVAPMTINKARSQAVYFSHPFLSVSIVPLVKKPAPGAPMPFNGVSDLLSKVQSGNLSIGYIRHGSTERYMSEHKWPKVRSLYNASRAAHTPNPYVDSLASAVQRVRNDPNFVFFGEHTAFLPAVLSGATCDLTIGWSAMIGERFYGFAFPKTATGREWVDRFNELIIAAQEDGTVANLFNRWWFSKATCSLPSMCACRQEVPFRGQGEQHNH